MTEACSGRRRRVARRGDAERRRPARGRRRSRADRRGRRRAAMPRAPPGGLERGEAEREVRGERAGVRAAGAVGGAVGVALAGDLVIASPSKKTSVASSRWPPVTTTFVRAEGVERAGELLGVGAVAAASGRAPRGRSGVITVARGSSSSSRAPGGPCRRAAPRRTRRPSRGRSRPACRGRAGRAPARTARDGLGRAEHPDLHGVDADVVLDGPDLLDDELAAGPRGRR